LVGVHTGHIAAKCRHLKADNAYNFNKPICSRACLQAFGLSTILKKASDKNMLSIEDISSMIWSILCDEKTRVDLK